METPRGSHIAGMAFAVLITASWLAVAQPANAQPANAQQTVPAGNTQTPVAPSMPAPLRPPPPTQAPVAVLTPPATGFVYVVILVVAAVALIALMSVFGALRGDRRWSLADALSEESNLPIVDVNGAPVLTSDGKAVTAPKLVASSSRLIALLGLMGILSLYLGFGTVVLFYFSTGQGVPPGNDDIRNFLLAGMAMFAPYVVNKFASVFQSFTAPTK